MSLEDHRREYQYGKLSRSLLNDDPFKQFQLWMDQAVASDVLDPTAMILATVAPDGKPWQRTVLLKGFSEQGFVFYTNYGSRKALDIAGNAQVSLFFPWLSLDRQVTIGGRAEKLSVSQSLGYFVKRPRDSQLAVWTSRQSQQLSSRQMLESQFAKMKEKFAKGDIPLPDFWGGYRIVPEEIQFWQGGENRLHDRFQYLRGEQGWQISRLAP